jgi:hypothetical protein
MWLRHRPWKGSCSCLSKSGMRGARRRKLVRGPGLDPPVIAVAVAEVATTVEVVEDTVVMAKGPACLADA